MDKMTDTDHKVIAMSDFQPHSGYGPLAQVEAYWDALRNGRDMPKRAEIDPRGIENALEYAFILERVAPGVARVRIAGSHLQDLMGMEVRGMPITSFFDPSEKTVVAAVLEEVFQKPATAELQLFSAKTVEQPAAAHARMLLLPLKSDLGDVSRILGCMICPDAMGRAPRSFSVAAKKVRMIGDAGLGLTPSVPRMPDPEKSGGFAEPADSFSRPNAAKRPAYLRLIKNDD